MLAPGNGFKTADQKMAFLTGAVRLAPDAKGLAAPIDEPQVFSVAEAMQVLTHASVKGPASSHPLTVTAASLTRATFDTDRGRRSLRAWAFHFAGLAEPALVIAEKPPAVVIIGSRSEAEATLSPDGRQLTVEFTGGPPGTGPCTESYTGRLSETKSTVTVRVTRQPSHERASPNVICSAVGYRRTLTLTLSHPLGDRVVLAGGDVVAVHT